MGKLAVGCLIDQHFATISSIKIYLFCAHNNSILYRQLIEMFDIFGFDILTYQIFLI